MKEQDVLAELPEELRDSVKIVETRDSLEVTHGYFDDKERFNLIYDAIVKLGGKYFGYYDGQAHYFIPKPAAEEPPKGVTPALLQMENEKNETKALAVSVDEPYSLKKSSKKLGKLYPVLKDSKGNIIDGRHRKQVDPHWPSLTCHDIDSPIKLHLARLTANFCRRTVPKEELEENIGFLIGAGLKPEKIAETTGISLRTVYNYMPQMLKDKVKVEAGRKGGEVAARLHQTVKTHDTPQTSVYADKIECGMCHQATPESEAKQFQNKKLCPSCFDKLPAAYKKVARIPKPRNQVEKPKSFDKWEHRVARMHPQVSKFDQAMLIRLQNNVKLREAGWKIEFQKPYVKTICVSDVTLSNPKLGKELLCFFDHPKTHKHPEKDTEKREEAAKLHHAEFLPLPYKACTETECVRVEKQILETLEV